MKLLAVMRYFPWPPRTGSTLVAYHSIAELAKRHSVSLVCLERPADTSQLAGILDEMHFPEHASEPTPGVLTKMAAIAAGVPALIYNSASRRMQKAVSERIDCFDAIVLFEMQAIQYIPASARGMAFANIEDPPSLKCELYSRLPVYTRRQRARLLLESRLLARYERQVLPPLARVLLLSAADVARMRSRGGHVNLGHVGYGTTPPDGASVPPWMNRHDGAIVLSGNMSHGPNIDGALWFLREVLPLILQDAPEAALSIIGADPDARIVAMARRFSGRVIVTGKVADLTERIGHARVSVCPIRVPIGVQTKILEALAAGTPVVTTSAGNAGIGGVSGQHLWVADDAPTFAHRVVQLLRGDDWERLADHGRRLVATEFTWQRCAETLERFIEEAASTRHAPG
jgi:glycosyltransferase involved in cell wall biosynthesis